MEINLVLSFEEVQYIVGVLSKTPLAYVQVAPLLNKIEQQAQAQLQPPIPQDIEGEDES